MKRASTSPGAQMAWARARAGTTTSSQAAAPSTSTSGASIPDRFGFEPNTYGYTITLSATTTRLLTLSINQLLSSQGSLGLVSPPSVRFMRLVLKSCFVYTGKSLWIYYALCRRLAERKPVIWHHVGIPYLFVEEGVYKMPPEFPAGCFYPIVWTLIDSDDVGKEHLRRFVPQGTKLFAIYVASPIGKPWSRMHKTVFTTVAIMNAWTRREIHHV
jgi:hypothetical protein